MELHVGLAAARVEKIFFIFFLFPIFREFGFLRTLYLQLRFVTCVGPVVLLQLYKVNRMLKSTRPHNVLNFKLCKTNFKPATLQYVHAVAAGQTRGRFVLAACANNVSRIEDKRCRAWILQTNGGSCKLVWIVL